MPDQTSTAILPCYTYSGGKLTIHNHYEYRKLKKRNKVIAKALKEAGYFGRFKERQRENHE